MSDEMFAVPKEAIAEMRNDVQANKLIHRLSQFVRDRHGHGHFVLQAEFDTEDPDLGGIHIVSLHDEAPEGHEAFELFEEEFDAPEAEDEGEEAESESVRSALGLTELSAHESARSDQDRGSTLKEQTFGAWQTSIQELEASHPRMAEVIAKINHILSRMGI